MNSDSIGTRLVLERETQHYTKKRKEKNNTIVYVLF